MTPSYQIFKLRKAEGPTIVKTVGEGAVLSLPIFFSACLALSIGKMWFLIFSQSARLPCPIKTAFGM